MLEKLFLAIHQNIIVLKRFSYAHVSYEEEKTIHSVLIMHTIFWQVNGTCCWNSKSMSVYKVQWLNIAFFLKLNTPSVKPSITWMFPTVLSSKEYFHNITEGCLTSWKRLILLQRSWLKFWPYWNQWEFFHRFKCGNYFIIVQDVKLQKNAIRIAKL